MERVVQFLKEGQWHGKKNYAGSIISRSEINRCNRSRQAGCYRPARYIKSKISVDISLILGNLITVIFDYQIPHKPLKILSL